MTAILLLARTLVLAAVFSLTACNERDPAVQGWVEADLIFVGPDESGRIETLSVREGDHVETGAPLFTLDADLQRAEVNQNKATLANAKQAFDRAQQLLQKGAGTQKDFDVAQAALREIEARLYSSQTRLARRSMSSPVTGTVQQVYFRPGEMVSAGRPVVALLPPGNVKVRFFIPEPALASIAYGDEVTVRCDGCAELKARVTFISRTAEFTPPVIYSLEERAKLVYLIEAVPEDPGKLRVGQPVDVLLPVREASK
ncbi:MAG TPA: efflux RND transporter periplasmic adaptor subunit [Xanthobacteraceae bacterium]|nr:efflux RND transporter periplasmic adaptor subunit [Xanthobacteraceae bacterium]